MKPNINFHTFLLLICLCGFVSAQKDAVELDFTQPSSLTHVRMMYDRYSNISGQQYTIIIQNLTNKNIHVKAQLVAILVCGNEVSTKFDVVIKPGETEGGNAYISDGTGMTGKVDKDDCSNPQITKNEKGIEQRNRIKALSLRSYSSIIEKTEEEVEAEKKKEQEELEAKKIANELAEKKKIEDENKKREEEERIKAEKIANEKAAEARKAEIIEKNNRAKSQYEQNRIENNAMMVGVGEGIFKIWDLFQNEGKNHEYQDICSHFSIDLGLNISNMPLSLNENYSFYDKLGNVIKSEKTTTAENPTYTNFLLGVNYFPLMSNKLSVGFNSKIAVGPSFEAIAGGGSATSTSNYSAHGYDFVYQGGAEIQVGRILTSLNYIKKKWEYTTSYSSYDVNTGNDYASFATGSSESRTLRYGLGVRLLKHEKKTNLDLMVLLDNLSYYNNKGNIFDSPILYRASLWNHSMGKVNIDFSPSYPVAGIPLYSEEALFKPHFSVDLVLNITRFKSHDIDFNYSEVNQANERRGELIGFIDYSRLSAPVFEKNFSGLGVNLKYKKVINNAKRENYIDFQMSANGTMASNQNEYKDFETTRLLNLSPDIRFTKKIIPSFYVGVILGINSLSTRNTIPFYDANVIFDSQHYFLQGSIGGTLGLMYSRKKSIVLNYYFRPSILGKNSQNMVELELAYKVIYLNASYIKMPEFNAGYVYQRNLNVLKFGIGCRMPW